MPFFVELLLTIRIKSLLEVKPNIKNREDLNHENSKVHFGIACLFGNLFAGVFPREEV